MKILFIANLRVSNKYLFHDNATRYRCFNPAEDLNDSGHIGDVCNFEEFDTRYIDWYDAFVFHRPRLSSSLESILAKLSSRNKLFFADYDDLIFDERYASESPLYLSGMESLKTVCRRYRNNLQAMQLFDKITVSTDELKKTISTCHPGSGLTVIHNGLSRGWLKSNISLGIKNDPSKKKVVTYLSGSLTHDHDFLEVEEVLARYMQKHEDIFLRVVGPLNFNRNRFRHGRVMTSGLVPYNTLPKLISESWITIAPLQNTFYNNCKTALKYFESAAFGIPVIASPIPDMLRYSDNGLLTAYDQDDWINAIEKLRDKEQYTKISEQIMKYSHAHCISSLETAKMVRLINGLFSKGLYADSKFQGRHNTIFSSGNDHHAASSQVSKAARLTRKLIRNPRKFIFDSKVLRILAIRGILGTKRHQESGLLQYSLYPARRRWKRDGK